MGGGKSKPPPLALHAAPGGFHPHPVFRVARKLYHKMPLVGRIGPLLKAVFYAVLGAVAPRGALVQRYKAWCSLQERKRFFREPLPGLAAEQNRGAGSGAAGVSSEAPTSTLPDIIFFPVIDWDYRFQRPQQLAVQFARRGHRVYYLEPEVDARGEVGGMPALKTERENLFRVMLPHKQPLKIYEQVCSPEQAEALRTSLERLLDQVGRRPSISLLNHPCWFPVARHLPSNVLVYDCMDFHPGFGGMESAMQQLEEECARHVDVLVVTAGALKERFKACGDAVFVPNAADFAYFSRRPASVQRYAEAQVIGYFGAIAEWFDVELVVEVAKAHPKVRVALIGDTHGADLALLENLENVSLLGEVPYEELTRHLYGFDVCLLPFKVNALTLATSPVKVYEYLCAGKPVVSVRLPEVEALAEHVHVAGDRAAFLAGVSAALEEGEDAAKRQARIAYAAEHTWARRAETLWNGILQKGYPKVSVIVLTWNNLELTKACLRSILEWSAYPNFELIVADNGSSDGTQACVERLSREDERVKGVFHGRNLGFAAGNNRAVSAASGAYLVFLNNDTVVTPGWIHDLLRHFRDQPRLGLLGPVSNNVGNEARIEVRYEDFEDMRKVSRAWCRARAGRTFALRAPAFFCVMISRRLWDAVGPLDERFGLGFFEDDDYAMRVREAGYEVRCAEDVFIHHHLSATFDQRDERENAALFERNRKLYEEKWGLWIPHQERREGV